MEPKFVKDLYYAADLAADYGSTPGDRVYLGIEPVDAAIRGSATRHLTTFVGRPNGGKSLLLLQLIRANPDKAILYACPDESLLLVISKLATADHGMEWETFERYLQSDDRSQRQRAKDLLRETADKYPNLLVVEVALSDQTLSAALREAEQVLQRPMRAIVYDFSRLFRVEGDESAKLEALKYWGIANNYPMFVPHQVPKYSGRDGAPITLDSMRSGGEDVATHIIGVRRKWRWYQSIMNELEQKIDKATSGDVVELKHQFDEAKQLRDWHRDECPSLTINVVKSKTPPGTVVDEFDMRIEDGILHPLDGGGTMGITETGQVQWL